MAISCYSWLIVIRDKLIRKIAYLLLEVSIGRVLVRSAELGPRKELVIRKKIPLLLIFLDSFNNYVDGWGLMFHEAL